MLYSNYNSFFSPQNAQAQAADLASVHQARGQINSAANQALGNAASTRLQQPANFADAYANAYQSYAGGLGNMATAMANERSNLYGANAMAEAARQGALGNIASAGLGAYGSASNAAMNAWAQNQNAYNQSLASMQMANQGALGNLGVSRNNALGGLGSSYGQLGRAEAGAQAMGALGGLGGGGGSFSASGSGGPIASGKYGMGGGGYGGGGYGGGGTSSALSGLAGLRQDLMSPDMTNALAYGNADAMNRLDMQHYSSRGMPSQMLDQSLGGIMSLSAQNAGSIGAGMDQFYGNQQYAGDQSMSRMDAMRNDLGGGFGTVGNQIGTLWDNSLGKHFLTPVEQAQQAAEVNAMRRPYSRQRPVFTVQR